MITLPDATTLDLNEYLPQIDGTEGWRTLAEVKTSLDQFFDRYQITGETIGQIRAMIGEGRLIGRHLLYGQCGCIKGLYTLVTEIEDPHEFYAHDPSSVFEGLIYHIQPGMTPKNNRQVAKLDALLALCQAERSVEG